MSKPTRALSWCTNDRRNRREHTWTGGVDGTDVCDRPRRRAFVWTSLQDGHDKPILVGVESAEEDIGGEAWLSVAAAEDLRDALSIAIRNA